MRVSTIALSTAKIQAVRDALKLLRELPFRQELAGTKVILTTSVNYCGVAREG
jgi:hypothetical protein